MDILKGRHKKWMVRLKGRHKNKKVKKKNEDILLNLDNILSNIINKYYNMFNIGNYFENFKKSLL